MKRKAKQLLSGMLAVLMAVLLVAGIFAPTAHAGQLTLGSDSQNNSKVESSPNDSNYGKLTNDTDSNSKSDKKEDADEEDEEKEDYRDYRKYETVIKLNGRGAEGEYELTTKDLYLFSLEGSIPGDVFYGSVKVENDTDTDMAISLDSIKSTLKHDKALFKALDLKVQIAGKTVYDGSYGAGKSPVTKFYMIKAGEVMYFDIKVTFPGYSGNELQGRQMDSTWSFNAVYFDPPETMVDYNVYYVDANYQNLLEPKSGQGYHDQVITEYAPEIDGYVVNALSAQMVLDENGENNIFFIYYPEQGQGSGDEAPIIPDDPVKPIDPSNPPSSPSNPGKPGRPGGNTGNGGGSDIIKTGLDLMQSNTATVTYLFIFLLAAIAFTMIYFRIRSAKKQLVLQNREEMLKSKKKEDA